MAQGTWSTKEDVLKDLEMASGRQVTDVDDGCVVVGQRPPPPRVLHDEDDEIEMQFGRVDNTHLSHDAIQPDLRGINQMLRMVEDYEQSSDEDTHKAPLKPKSKNDTIVVTVVSKLNPNVQEFVPRCYAKISSPDMSNENNQSTANAGSKSIDKCKDDSLLENEKVKIENSKCDIISNIKNSKDEKSQMAAMLKSKILLKPETFEEKRDANLAIVNLLKLYSGPQSVTTPKTPKLLTPDFFQNSKASEYKITENDCPEINLTQISRHKDETKEVSTQETETTSIENSHPIVSDISHKNEELHDEDTSLTPNMAESSISKENVPSHDMTESINKVNNWFEYKPADKREKPKSPALFLGPVSYKRKDSVTCKSPSDVDKKILKSSVKSDAYKPSIYAEELLKKYNKKKEKVAPIPQLNIWEKLEDELKKKDEIIRLRQKEG